jgi:hypothetical protein
VSYQAIYARLTASGTQTQAIVGASVYPDINLATGTRFVVIEADDGETDQAYDGPLPMTKHAATVSAVGPTRLACEQLAAAIRVDLDGQRGSWGGVTVRGAFLQAGNAGIFPLADGAARRLYGKDIEFVVWTE